MRCASCVRFAISDQINNKQKESQSFLLVNDYSDLYDFSRTSLLRTNLKTLELHPSPCSYIRIYLFASLYSFFSFFYINRPFFTYTYLRLEGYSWCKLWLYINESDKSLDRKRKAHQDFLFFSKINSRLLKVEIVNILLLLFNIEPLCRKYCGFMCT